MPDGVFSLFDCRVGLPRIEVCSLKMTLSSKLLTLSSAMGRLFLFGEFGVSCWRPPLVGLVGMSFMALSKILGRSFAPGGILFLLGLP